MDWKHYKKKSYYSLENHIVTLCSVKSTFTKASYIKALRQFMTFRKISTSDDLIKAHWLCFQNFNNGANWFTDEYAFYSTKGCVKFGFVQKLLLFSFYAGFESLEQIFGRSGFFWSRWYKPLSFALCIYKLSKFLHIGVRIFTNVKFLFTVLFNQ